MEEQRFQEQLMNAKQRKEEENELEGDEDDFEEKNLKIGQSKVGPQVTGLVEESRLMHGKNSYYYNNPRIEDEMIRKKLQESGKDYHNPKPQAIQTVEVKKEKKRVEIKNYLFMDDEKFAKVFIEFEKYPSMSDMKEHEFQVRFETTTYFEVIAENEEVQYSLKLFTRQPYILDKSSFLLKPNKLILKLKKEIDGSWYGLKATTN